MKDMTRTRKFAPGLEGVYKQRLHPDLLALCDIFLLSSPDNGPDLFGPFLNRSSQPSDPLTTPKTFIMAAALAASGVVVGMRQLTGEVRTRMDIDVLLTTQPDTFNLFLQALAALQGDPKLLGYYALAGGWPRS